MKRLDWKLVLGTAALLLAASLFFAAWQSSRPPESRGDFQQAAKDEPTSKAELEQAVFFGHPQFLIGLVPGLDPPAGTFLLREAATMPALRTYLRLTESQIKTISTVPAYPPGGVDKDLSARMDAQMFEPLGLDMTQHARLDCLSMHIAGLSHLLRPGVSRRVGITAESMRATIDPAEKARERTRPIFKIGFRGSENVGRRQLVGASNSITQLNLDILKALGGTDRETLAAWLSAHAPPEELVWSLLVEADGRIR